MSLSLRRSGGDLQRALALVALLSVSLLLAAPAAAVTIHVATGGEDDASCGDVGDPCATLNHALGLGSVTGPGDIIEMAAGSYTLTRQDNVTITKNGQPGNPLVVRGAGPTTVLDAAEMNNGSPIIVDGSHVVLEDFVVTSGPYHNIWVRDPDVTLRRVVSLDAMGGGASCIMVQEADGALLEDVDTDTCANSGVMVEGGVDVTIVGGVFSGSQIQGIYALGVSGLSIEGARVVDNAFSASTDGILLDGCSAFAIGPRQDSYPTEVLRSGGPGLRLVDSTDGTIDNLVLAANGAGLQIDPGTGPTLSVDHVSIAGHSAGPAIADGATGTTLSVTNSVIAFNPGGGLTVTGATHSYNLRHENGSDNVVADGTELDADPLFADLSTQDLHLRSEYGRHLGGVFWTTDSETSPAIDLADPGAPYSAELAPNGGRANAGAFGNTTFASLSAAGPLPDAGLSPDAAAPDTAAPDTAAPDTAAIDTSAADMSTPDLTAADSAVPDALAADAVGPRDGPRPDVTQQDAGSVEPDGSSGVAVVARAGADRSMRAPAEVVLDGTASTAPANASYVWTLADGPQGPEIAPVANQVLAQVRIEAPGLYIYQLTVASDGISDSDLLEILVESGDPTAAEGCGCAGARSARGLWLPLLIVAGLTARAKRRTRATAG